MPFLVGVDKARFRSFVGPGADLAIEAGLEHEGLGFAVTSAAIRTEGKALSSAELRFKLMPFPAGPRRSHARARERDRPPAGARPVSRRVLVTGLGLVSAAGETVEAHLAAFDRGGASRVDAEAFAPYPIHPVVPLEWDRQIPKKSDQRQMEPWQRLGCYAAGLALDSGGAKGDAALKDRMHLIVAAGGGERDYAVDGAILTGLRDAPDPGAYLNERLMGDLRPTLFLAQLSNLLAGNISIVHGVTGASRTFMGEEQAGVDALRIARERIAAGQADIVLVGGAYNAERPDVLLIYEMGGFLWKKPFRPVFERPSPGGFVLGSAAAFLLLEAEDHAAARGARGVAELARVASDRTRREPGTFRPRSGGCGRRPAPGPRRLSCPGRRASPGSRPRSGSARDARAGLAPRARVICSGQHGAQAPAGAVMAAACRRATPRRRWTSVGHRRGERRAAAWA
jgi:3-oxoacyl-[acyl-carrier-protein] synthase II